jgi:glycosyltransferase involved in cell wall biosynthesis
MTSTSSAPVAYLMKRYPRLSETFILNEIWVMESLGTPLELFSLLPPEPPPHHPLVGEIKARLHHLPLARGAKLQTLLAAHGRSLRAHPLRYGHALGRAFVASLQSRRPLSVWKQFVRAGFVADRCAARGVGLIHAHFANAPAAVAAFASVISGIPFSFTTHAKDLYLTSQRVLRRRVHDARFVTTCTGYNVDYLKGFLPAAEHDKVHLVYHGIDLARFSLRAPESPRANGVPLILSVGRLVPKKGFADLIAACALLREQGIGFQCAIVGEGPLRAELAADIARRGLTQQVRLLGAMTHGELAKFYHQADIFALAPQIIANGDRDGIPNVIVEAMASGVPVVSTAVSGIPEVVRHERTGLLVPSESPAAFAEALRQLIGNPAIGVRLARAARELLEAELDCLETTQQLKTLMAGCACGHDHAPVVDAGALDGIALSAPAAAE